MSTHHIRRLNSCHDSNDAHFVSKLFVDSSADNNLSVLANVLSNEFTNSSEFLKLEVWPTSNVNQSSRCAFIINIKQRMRQSLPYCFINSGCRITLTNTNRSEEHTS